MPSVDPAVRAPHAQAQAQVRIPKLAYRNPLPADQTSLSSHASQSSASLTDPDPAPARPEDNKHRLLTPIVASASSPLRPSFESRSLTSSSLASSNASTSSKDSKKQKKKKPNAMIGFLTLKEPSQSAFEQFAQQQRKLAADKGGKASPNTSASVSVQRLPANVPKVNSRWDGVPEAVKARDKRNSTLSQGRSSLSSMPNSSLFSLASGDSRDPPNSLASAASSVVHLPSRGTHKHNGPSSGIDSPETPLSPLPEMTYFFPDNPNPTGVLLSDCSPLPDHQSALPMEVSATPVQPPYSSVHTEASAVIPADKEHGSRLNHISPVQPSVTDEASTTRAFDGEKAIEHGRVIWRRNSESDEDDYDLDDLTPHDFLFEDPTVAMKDVPLLAGIGVSRSPLNFSRPLPPQHAADTSATPRTSVNFVPKMGVSRLPTLYEASIASTTDTLDTVVGSTTGNADLSTLDSDAVSITPSTDSTTPSEMSASWHRSPRERLGLGGRIRRNDILPWDSHEGLQTGKRKKNPLSMVFRST